MPEPRDLVREPLRVDIVGYRQWARRLYEYVASILHVTTSATDTVQIDLAWMEKVEDIRADASIAFLVGWSDIIDRRTLDTWPGRLWIVLHPSPLPRYRGGSPIQHQIIDGQDTSAVSLFRLLPGYSIDAGPLCWQQGFSLLGTLDQVLDRIARVGARGVAATIAAKRDGLLTFWEQPQTDERSRPRRTPPESEITPEELQTKDAKWLYDKVRALQAPYPLPYIRTAEGGALVLRDARYVVHMPTDGRGGDVAFEGGPTA